MSREWVVWNLPVVVWPQPRFKSHKGMFQKQIGLNCDTTADMICMSVIYYQPKHLYTRLLFDFFFPPKKCIHFQIWRWKWLNSLHALKLCERQVLQLWTRGSETPTEPFLKNTRNAQIRPRLLLVRAGSHRWEVIICFWRQSKSLQIRAESVQMFIQPNRIQTLTSASVCKLLRAAEEPALELEAQRRHGWVMVGPNRFHCRWFKAWWTENSLFVAFTATGSKEKKKKKKTL